MIREWMTPEETAALAEIQEEIEAAEKRVTDLEEGISKIEGDARNALTCQRRERSRLALAYLGENNEPAPAAGPTAAELGAAKEVLEGRLVQARADVEDLRGAMQHKWIVLLEGIAQRAAVPYAQAAKQVETLHTLLGGIQAVLNRASNGMTAVLDPNLWDRLDIPGSQVLAALRDKGNPTAPAFGVRSIVGGEPTLTSRKAQQAKNAIEVEITSSHKGRWPFRRHKAA